MENKKNYYEEFLKEIKEISRTTLREEDYGILSIYRCAFEMMGEKSFNSHVEGIVNYDGYQKEDWFFYFHKMFRQADVTQDVFRIKHIKTETVNNEGKKIVKRSVESVKDLGGNVDWIIWNAIHVDSKCILQDIFDRVVKK